MKTFLTILACFLPGFVIAQNEFEILTVQSALEFAYRNNAELNQARELITQKKAQKRLATGFTSPFISFTKEGLDGDGFLEQRWSVSQTLDFPISMIHRTTVAGREIEALTAHFESRKLELKAAVKKAYTRVAYTLEIVHLRDEQVRLASEIESISMVRNRVGESSKLDVLQAQLQLSAARNNYSDAISELQNARYELFNTIGLSPEDQSYGIEFPDTLAYISADLDQQLILNALAEYPAIQRDRAFIASSESMVRVRRSAYLPSITGSYFRQDFGNGYDFNGFEISLSVPIWFAVDQAPQVTQAKSELRTSQLRLQQDKLALKTEAEKAWHSFESVEQQIKDYNSSIRARSTELLTLTREAYRVGEIPLVTLLEAQRTYLQSQEHYLTALHSYYNYLTDLEKFLQTDLIYVD